MLYPSVPTTFQARTAAPSRASEIAVNSRIFNERYTFYGFDLVLSQASYVITVPAELFTQTAAFDFRGRDGAASSAVLFRSVPLPPPRCGHACRKDARPVPGGISAAAVPVAATHRPHGR